MRRWACGPLGSALVGIVAVPVAPASAAAAWGGSVALASDDVFRGASQSEHAAVAQADAHWRSPEGWFVGAWATSIGAQRATFGDCELDLYGGRGWLLGERAVASLRYRRYTYPTSAQGRRYDADEIAAALEFDDRLVLSAAASPDASRYVGAGWALRRRTYAYEASLRQPLTQDLAFVASAGLYDTRDLYGASYRAWSAGLAGKAGPLDIGLVRFGVDAAARRIFRGDSAQGRWALSAAWRY
ncbi:MAG: TorF family putative porin [Burkholderiales bacterium]|nr:TorF family putative porin [Burkholderiales bacterium]